MRQAELRRALRLEVGELAEVIVEALRAAAIEARPERRLTNRGAARRGHRDVIVRDAADHVSVRFDVAHVFLGREEGGLNRNPNRNPSR